jgi:outer membrane protein assembly factor BamB
MNRLTPTTMKTTIVLTTMLLAAGLKLSAQEEMGQEWTSRLDHKIDYSGVGDYGAQAHGEHQLSYAASDKDMTVFENATGKPVWTKAFKDLSPNLRKIDELIPFWESATVFLFDRKMGKDQIACIDLKSGAALWTTDKYQGLTDENVIYIPEKELFAISTADALTMIKARTGEELWSTQVFTGSVGKYIIDGNDMVCVNFVGAGLAALFSGFKNQIARIDLSNGNVKWQSTYIGRAERKVVTRKFVYDLKMDQGKVYLMLNGMQVYDYATGALQWSAAFDFTPEGVVGEPAHAVKFGVYGAVAEPVVVGNDLYVLDCKDRRKQFVKKYDRLTGKLLWTSPEIPARAIPGMYVEGDKVLLQIGGRVETQAYLHWVERTSTETITHDVWQVKYVDVKPYGIKAFNTSDGAMAWESERFKKGITNGFVANNTLYVCSGKALYALDCAKGTEKYEVLLKDDNISDASVILPYKDRIAIVGEKGVSTHAQSDGKLLASGKYKAADLYDHHDNIVLVQTDGSDIAAFDLDNCTFKQFNARKGAVSSLSNDGAFVYVFEKKDVTKLRTH